MANIASWLKKEIREILPVWAFFFVTFGLLAFTLSTVLGEYDVSLSDAPKYFLGALIVAKAIVLIDSFFQPKLFLERPRIYLTFWNTGIYFFAALLLRHVDRIAKLTLRQHLGLAAADRRILDSMEDPRYWVTIMWIAILIFAFCILRELIRAIGWDRFVELFFVRRRGADLRKVS